MQQSEIFISIAVFIFVGFILALVAAQSRAKIRYRAEVQKELIGRFTSSRELAEFLNSEAGKLLIRDSNQAVDPRKEAPAKSAKQHVLEGLGLGILGLCIGGAIFIVRGMSLPAAVFTALGVGFILNALLGYLLTRKWGFWNLKA